MLFRTFLLIFLGLITFSSNSYSQFEQQPTFLPVEEAYRLSPQFNPDQAIELNWQIAPEYYLYRHSFKFGLKDLSTQQTLALSPQIAKGLAKHDEYFGDVEVYYLNSQVTLKPIPNKENLLLEVTSQGCADAGLCYPPRTQYFRVNGLEQTIVELDSPPVIVPISSMTTTTLAINNAESSPASLSFIYILLSAMIGGAILNLMPCVFPVLSLKVLSFTNDKQHSHSLHGLSYTAGVVISFISVAAILISLQAAGKAVGWGFQLQSPWFVAALAYLFFVMGLSLSGVIELGAEWMGIGGKLASQAGYSGSFFTGVLATVVASPCTAPFMGSALGYAVTQTPVTALTVFGALGFGMALPVLLLSHAPKLLSKMPKPGPWMDKLKQFLAFPLYATTLWLCWVAGNQTGANGMLAILAGCLLLAMTIWFWSKHWPGRSLSILSLAGALWLLSSSALTPSTISKHEKNWQSYSPELLAQLRNDQKPVFINLTADWCITCLANEKVTLSTDEVKQSFEKYGIQYLKGDWTNHNKEIGELLKQHQRTGIPLYLFYPADKSSSAIILPQILSKDLIINTFKQYSTITSTQK